MKQSVSLSAQVLLQPSLFHDSTQPNKDTQLLLNMLKDDGTCPIPTPRGYMNALFDHLATLKLPGYPAGGALEHVCLSPSSGLFVLLATEVSKLSLVEPYQNYVRVYLDLLSNKAVNAALAASPLFCFKMPSDEEEKRNPTAGRKIEQRTLLGPLFRLSTLPTNNVDYRTGELIPVRHPVGEACFCDPLTRRGDLEINVESVRSNLKSLQASLVAIVKALIKDKGTQEATFNWFSVALSSNLSRTKDWFNYNRHMEVRLSTNGFLFNCLAVLLELSKPFTDPEKPLFNKIDATYLLSKHRMDLSKETRVVASEDELASWIDVRNQDRINQYNQAHNQSTGSAASPSASPGGDGGGADNEVLTVSESFGTISEFFFLTLRSIHVFGPVRLLGDLQKIQREVYNVHQELRAAVPGSEEFQTLESKCNELLERQHCFMTVTHDQQMLEDIVKFARLTGRWLLKLAGAPENIVPLPEKPSRIFSTVPEWCFDAVLDSIRFVAMSVPSVLELMSLPVLHDLCNFLVAFASSQQHIKSPHLRGKIMEVLKSLIPKGRDMGFEHEGGNLSTLFQDHKITVDSLVHVLIQFYIDCEVTGAHNQFYEKHEYRQHMGELLLYVAQFPAYLDSLRRESEDSGKFIR
jgi:ubiquitin conjugation factor E4 B